MGIEDFCMIVAILLIVGAATAVNLQLRSASPLNNLVKRITFFLVVAGLVAAPAYLAWVVLA